MVPPQGTGRLLDLQTPMTVQPSEPRLQDTVSPSEAFQPELIIDNLRAISEITSTEVKSSATATDSEAQQLITPRNVIQPLRNTHIMNTGNASESPAAVMNTPQPLSERQHTSVEVSGTTTSEGDVCAADVGTMGSTNSLPSSPEGHQINANLSGGRIDPKRRLSFLEADPLVPDWALTLYQPTTALIHDLVNLRVGSAETIPGSTPSPDQGTTDAVGANLSGDGNDPERRFSGVDPPVTDMAAADGHYTAQTPRQPLTVLPNDQVNPSVGNAETDPGNTPSPSSSSQAAIDGVGANRDASSSKNPPVSGFKGFFKNPLKSVADIFKPCHTEDEIIDMAARDYDLEHLKNGVTVDEFNRRIDKWKEIEDHIVRQEVPFPIPDPLDYGQEWQVFHALQLWYYYAWHQKKKGNFPPGYRTLFDRSKDEILRRSRPTLFAHHRGDQTLIRDDGR